MKNNQEINNTLPITSKYLIIPNSSMYDEEQQMWRTNIGLNNKDRPLRYTVWGKTEEESNRLAHELVASIEL